MSRNWVAYIVQRVGGKALFLVAVFSNVGRQVSNLPKPNFRRLQGHSLQPSDPNIRRAVNFSDPHLK
jgi:hypothetical protein